MAIPPWVPAAIAQRLSAAEGEAETGRWPRALELTAREFDDLKAEDIVRLLLECSDHGRQGALAFVETRSAIASALERSWAAAMLLALGRPLESLSEARQAVETEPLDRIALDVLGRAALRCREIGEANSAAERLIEVAPTWPEAWELLSEALGSDGKLAEARKAAERAVTVGPKSVSAWRRLGAATLAQGDSLTAVKVLCTLETLAPGLPDTREMLSEALTQFESQAARRQLPLAIAAVLAMAGAVLVVTRLFFLAIGLPLRLAVWASIPPAILLVPLGLSQFRRLILRPLPAWARDIADAARESLQERSATERLTRRLFFLGAFVACEGALFVLQFRDQPGAVPWVLGFFALSIGLGWLRYRFSRVDRYFSIKEP